MKNKLDAVTIVVATQRSGSTLLCADIASLGGMGRPDEFFLPVFKKLSGQAPSEAHVIEALSTGEQEACPGTGAVKIMVNYAPRVSRFLDPENPRKPLQALEHIVSWSRSQFDRVNLVTIMRENILDQAISRVVARKTQIYHCQKSRTEKRGHEIINGLPLDSLYPQILAEVPLVQRDQKIMQDFIDRHSDICLSIGYDQLSADVKSTSRSIVTHAAINGFFPIECTAKRRLRKVIENDKSKEIKEGFRDYIERSFGLWPK